MNVSAPKIDDIYDNVILSKSMLAYAENVTEIGNLIFTSPDDNETLSANDTLTFEPKEYIFDRKGVRFIFVTLYSLVFCCCFFGKSRHSNLRSNPERNLNLRKLEHKFQS